MNKYPKPGGSSEISSSTDRGQLANRLLAELPPRERDQLVAKAETVWVPAGNVLCDPSEPVQNVHFPLSGVMSSVVSLASGAVVEAAIIGNEGLAGIPALFNDYRTPTRIVQRMEGESLRVDVQDVQEVLAESAVARGIIVRYTLTLFQQCAQNVACNLHHRLEERLCRWLVETADRAEVAELRVTQEFLSEMLGVSRQSINVVAGTLQQRGLISYRRGRLEIVDRAGLEGAGCECYETTRTAYHRLMQAA